MRLVIAFVGVLVAAAVMLYACDPRAEDPLTGAPAATVSSMPAAMAPGNEAHRAAAIAKFKGMPAVRQTEWVDGNFVIMAVDNGKPWQPVADAACSWIRQRGLQGEFSVNVIEASAALNKRWDQLAHARCH